MGFELSADYIDVAERIRDFKREYPTGSLQQVSIELAEFAGSCWVIYTAAAYRTPDDARPGHGTAWEPVPGKTPYTKGSEVQNAETAAWGRAIVAALAGETKRIATREDVQIRQADQAADAAMFDARKRVRLAWTNPHGHHGTEWDPAAMTADYEQWSAQPLADATADDLNRYATHLEEPKA